MQNQRATTGKNLRSKQRRASKKAAKRSEAELRQQRFDALPEAEKASRRESRLRRKGA